MVDKIRDANAILFLVDSNDSTNFGMLKHRTEYDRGATGIAIGVVANDSLNPADMESATWTYLGNGGTQDGIMIVGDPDSTQIERVHMLSMEGSHSPTIFAGRDQAQAMQEVVKRVRRLAACKKVTDWIEDKTMPPEIFDAMQIPYQIIDAGTALNRMGLLPNVKMEQYVQNQTKATMIKLFMSVSGLSIGNLSAWDNVYKVMHVTGSGFDKSQLKRNEVVAVNGIKDDLSGPITWGQPNAKKIKPSVETVDQLLAYFASALIMQGMINEPDIQLLLEMIRDRDLLRQVLEKGPHLKSIVHLHLHPTEADSARFNVVDVNPNLTEGGSHHSSCGTMPLALYTVEAFMRGMLETPDKDVIVELPNHGLMGGSHSSLPVFIRLLDPARGLIQFGNVKPH